MYIYTTYTCPVSKTNSNFGHYIYCTWTSSTFFAKIVFIEIISPVLHIPIIVTHLVTHSLKIYTLCIMHISLMIQNDVLHIFLATNMYFILIFRYWIKYVFGEKGTGNLIHVIQYSLHVSSIVPFTDIYWMKHGTGGIEDIIFPQRQKYCFIIIYSRVRVWMHHVSYDSYQVGPRRLLENLIDDAFA